MFVIKDYYLKTIQKEKNFIFIVKVINIIMEHYIIKVKNIVMEVNYFKVIKTEYLIIFN